jgi:hypothetical protein
VGAEFDAAPRPGRDNSRAAHPGKYTSQSEIEGTYATGNPRFRRFLDFLGRFIIPRVSVRIRALNLRAYLMTFQREHRAIVAAIDARSVDQARAAMREHMT